MSIGVGSRVAWLGAFGSRTGRVIRTTGLARHVLVVADDTGSEVTVRLDGCTLLVDDHAQKVRPLTERTEVGS